MEPGSFWTALIWAIVPMLLLLAAIWWVDRYEKEPLRLLGLALVFGGVLAPAITYALDRAFDIATSLSSQQIVPEPSLGVGTPLVEEVVRGLAILAVFLLVRFEIDDLLDGLVYGGIVGLGFGAAANFVGIWNTPSLGSDTDSSLYTSLISQLNHVFYGAVIGLALAAVRRREFPILLGAIWWVDRYEKEPLRLLGLALLFGGLLAPAIAYALDRAFDIATSLSSQQIVPEPSLGIGTPLVEEVVRGLAILAVFLLVRFEIDDLLDGLVYGGIVGLGFGAAANFVGIWNTPSL
ncbi:MAG: PrsW family intramembrane metalloprotease, partial [Actinobacteria bacterium]|nr:PrsW family intramembrane metalloprotease [Actinomycetota bacterium]